MRFRVLFLFIVNLVALFALFYMLDFFGVVNYYSMVKNRLMPKEKRVDDVYDLEREDMRKMRASYDEREHDLQVKEASIADHAAALETEQASLAEEWKALEVAQLQLENERAHVTSKQAIVGQIAAMWTGVPPASAVELITELANNGELQLILEVFERMDADAAAAGTTSIRGYLMSLLPTAIAAQLTESYAAWGEEL